MSLHSNDSSSAHKSSTVDTLQAALSALSALEDVPDNPEAEALCDSIERTIQKLRKKSPSPSLPLSPSQAEDLPTLFFRNFSQPACILDENLILLYINTAFENFFASIFDINLHIGDSLKSVLQQRSDLLAHGWEEEVDAYIAEVQQGKSLEFNSKLISDRLLNLSLICLTSVEKKHYIAVYAKDITQEDALNNDLRQSQASLLSLLESIPAVIWSVDKDLRLIDFNTSAKIMAESLTGNPVQYGADTRLYILPENMERMLTAYNKVFGGEQQSLLFEFGKDIQSPDYSAYRMYISPKKDAEGTIIGATVITFDVTSQQWIEHELRQAREEALAANRLKSEFIANMSHEIRTPLNAVLGFAEMLHHDETDPRQRSYLEAIRTGGKSLLTIINDILDMSKIEAGMVEIKKEKVDIRRTVEEVTSIFSQTAAQKKIYLDYLIAPDVPVHLLLDEARLRQVLINIIGNAVKFTEKGSVSVFVEVEVAEKSTFNVPLYSLKLHVKDTGIGIAPENVERVFEPFRQTEEVNSKKYGGTGLGLSISRRLVNLMQGTISLDSHYGHGSTFVITLHDVEETSPGADISASGIHNKPDKVPALVEKRILIVDDSLINCRLVEEILKPTGAFVTRAVSGKQALELLKKTSFDALLLDINMPEIDGIEVAKFVRLELNNSRLPIFAFTALSVNTELSKRINKYCNGFISKPARKQEIISTLETAIKPESILYEHVDQEKKHLTEAEQQEIAQLHQKLQNLLRTRRMNEMDEFAENLYHFAESNSLDLLRVKSSELKGSISSFDIEQILENLQEIGDVFRNYLKK